MFSVEVAVVTLVWLSLMVAGWATLAYESLVCAAILASANLLLFRYVENI